MVTIIHHQLVIFEQLSCTQMDFDVDTKTLHVAHSSEFTPPVWLWARARL